jgi:predicted CoA-substrate-specific enzyme activase
VLAISKCSVGVNIGSVSVNVVSVDNNSKVKTIKEPHLGKPQEVLDQIIKKNFSNNECYYNVSGSFGEISEIVAVEKAINSYEEKFDVILSLGGEAFVLYVLSEEGHILNVLSHDKCAAGSGEFFVQQIDRLAVTLPEAIELAKDGKRMELASRCSVHCKSDVTHKLNRGEASMEDILASVLGSMANKVVGLIYQSRVDVKRLLLIGGVSLNDAFVKILREQIDNVEVVVKPESSVFEAYGTALIVKEKPVFEKVNLITSKSFTTFPSLKDFSSQVTIIEPTGYKKKFDKKANYILGVDVGSTTTKAVLMDSEDKSVLASYYGRTSGNPIQATRKCIEEIISQVGNLKVNLVGVTGSGRQLVGAYLGTSAVYNEISAHSEGAVFYDSEVDTIFEIGGQDSKYMYLQNSVPVDYAMNASCSAGTGSFLEESSKGDLGVDVFDISDIAMTAGNPVRFKADCAAFINTDVRTAMQEGYGSENIVGGLVYSIAENYLNKVKGSRQVGKKIFFQGGVAKNNSVGYAFAQTTGKQIIIPPNPELIGAFGIALIAQSKYENHEIDGMEKDTTLKSIIVEELNHLGHFTCKACKNYCQIERYEVGGRKFPFGGRCSKYEHQWRGSEKIDEKENLVGVRNDLVYAFESEKKAKKGKSKGSIGIPRALLTHTLYPLFSTFFDELGYEVILSDIDEERELQTNAPFCFPIQILHGAVLDLIKKEVDMIFVPHMHGLPTEGKWMDATFCPVTQGSPYFIKQAFKEAKFLSPLLSFARGYGSNKSLVKMAVKELNQPKTLAEQAFKKAISKQKAVENQFLDWGKEHLEKLKENGEIGIILLGRSYNAFPPETSQLIPKKLSSMGVTVIPFDFLEKKRVHDIPWYYSNYVKIAIDIAAENDNLFLLYINSFSCTIDAFVQNYVRSELRNKPYLFLELDAHTADAGTQTRLEAYLEIIKNFQASKKAEEEKEFKVTQVKLRDGKVVVLTSDDKKLSIKDPRVKLHFPSFSKIHTDSFQLGFKLLGYNVGESTKLEIDYPVRGLRHCSGKECIPLPIVLGQIMHLIETRKPGEVTGLFMIRGGSPCAVHSYFHYIEQFIEDNKLENFFIYRFDQLTDFLGTSRMTVAKYGTKALLLGDLVLEVESALQVVGEEGSLDLMYKYYDEFLENTHSLKEYDGNIDKLVSNFASIPRKASPMDYPKVLVSGDFFVRFSPFFLKELKEIYAKQGVLVKSTDVYELVLYTNYNLQHIIAHLWDTVPYKKSTSLRAYLTPWSRYSRLYIISQLAPIVMHRAEKKMRKRFEKTGLLFAVRNDLREIFSQSKNLISPLIFGEAIPTIGKGMETLEDSHFDSLILTGPMQCLPYKIAQAVLKPIYLEHNMPFLVFDVDISALTPNMKRLIHANIEQIKRRID